MIRQFLVRILDVFWREPNLVRKYYRLSLALPGKEGEYVFMADGRVPHGGMFDRLKGLISVYAVSKVHNKKFRINFTSPFSLEKYLEPNQYNWRLKNNEIHDEFPKARPLFLYGECYAPSRLMKKRNCQAHFYYGYDSLKDINAKFGTEYKWTELYHELFRPTAYLQQYIDKYKNEIGQNYIAVHTRFLNLLGDKMETDINPTLPTEKRATLMAKIAGKIDGIIAMASNIDRVLVASDSTVFIEYMQKINKNVYVIPGTIKHIDTAASTDDGDVIKMFLDYYMLAGAKKVYNIVAEGMWPSAFPEYAAKIGNTEFERIYL